MSILMIKHSYGQMVINQSSDSEWLLSMVSDDHYEKMLEEARKSIYKTCGVDLTQCDLDDDNRARYEDMKG